MEKTIKLAGFAIVLLTLLSFSNSKISSIKGKVVPAAYADNAWAISKNDTLYTTIRNGSFEFDNVKPGVYRLVIGAESPYRHTIKDNVIVTNGENIEVGTIPLEKYVVEFK